MHECRLTWIFAGCMSKGSRPEVLVVFWHGLYWLAFTDCPHILTVAVCHQTPPCWFYIPPRACWIWTRYSKGLKMFQPNQCLTSDPCACKSKLLANRLPIPQENYFECHLIFKFSRLKVIKQETIIPHHYHVMGRLICHVDEICPLVIPNQIFPISTHIPSFVKIH